MSFSNDKSIGLDAEMKVAKWFLLNGASVTIPTKTLGTLSHFDISASFDNTKNLIIEVKYDRLSVSTGNIVLETDSSDHLLTGFQVSKTLPVIYCWTWQTTLWFVSSEELHKLDFSKFRTVKKKGKSSRTSGYFHITLSLVPSDVIFKLSTVVPIDQRVSPDTLAKIKSMKCS